jgi:alkyldihydroxyacetonephosphate synthase
MDNDSSWTSWGADRPALSGPARNALKAALGSLTPHYSVAVENAMLTPSVLPAAVRAELVAALGEESVRDDQRNRAEHAGGQSYSDLVRRRRGDASDAPDAVLLPTSVGAINDVLRICSAARVAVVPWGGGTSVVGGLAALRGDCVAVVAVDLRRLNRLIGVDLDSLTATFEPGIRTPAAEAALAEFGLTIGHIPQSWERASLGGYVVTRSAGQASGGYGRMDDIVVGCRLATPVGELVLPAIAASAAGPDLRRLVMGSEGTLGIVTEVTVRVRRTPAIRRYEGWMARSWGDGVTIMRRLAQDGAKPDIARVSDEHETELSLTMSGTTGLTRLALDSWLRIRGIRGGALVIVGFEGTERDVRHRRREVRRILRAEGAVPIGASAGNAWEHNRFGGAYLRDSLLDAGVLAETLETATTWARLPTLYDKVGEALTESLSTSGTSPLVGCHISHLYPTGASLYFTVLANANTGREVEQWAAAKHAANLAIVAAGGTASHHHGVGTVHREIVGADLGGPDGVGIAALRAVKATLDPAGILNPGKLLPD